MKCNNIKCENDANPNLGTGRYCSRSCSNSRNHSEETINKIREGVLRTDAKRGPLNEESLAKWKSSISNHYKKLNESKPFDELGLRPKRAFIFNEQGGQCLQCGLAEWQGEPIALELDHINGDRLNNTRDNLRLLCPNCHSLTETWRGRNIQDHKKIIPDADILALIEKETMNPRQILLELGLVPKGGNYRRVYKLMALYHQMKIEALDKRNTSS
jgi:5-methylcytosine-specific restriction endonuclease McrA